MKFPIPTGTPDPFPTDPPIFDPGLLFDVDGARLTCRCCREVIDLAYADVPDKHADGCPARALLGLRYVAWIEGRDVHEAWRPLGTIEATCLDELTAKIAARVENIHEWDVELRVGYDPELGASIHAGVETAQKARAEAETQRRRDEEERGRRLTRGFTRLKRLADLEVLRPDLTPEGYERQRRAILDDPEFAELPPIPPPDNPDGVLE